MKMWNKIYSFVIVSMKSEELIRNLELTWTNVNGNISRIYEKHLVWKDCGNFFAIFYLLSNKQFYIRTLNELELKIIKLSHLF